MVRRVLAPVATLVVTVLAACQGDLPAPVAPDLLATSSLAGAPRLARSPAANEVVPGQYLVVFRAGVADGNGRSEAKAAEKIARARKPAKLKHTYSAVIKGFAAELSDEDVAALRADPDVAVVEPDPVVRMAGSQAGATWGLDRIDQASLPLNGTYSYGNDGSGVTVYILDTGINTGHVEFGGRAVAGYDAITSGGGAADCNGHGTHVAGTVGGATYGVAKNVRLVAVRVLDCSGNSAGSSLMAGMDWVTRQKQASPSTPMVANMSLVGAASSSFDQAVQNMINAGVTAVVAAGNSSLDACTVSPSRLPAAITVGASDQTDVYASFSNYGSCVDITAPGVVITSSYIGSTTATAAMSGTSMATPHVAGAAALYLAANRTATPAQVSGALVNNSVTGRILSLAGGQTNRLLSIAFLGGSVTEPAPVPAPTPAPSAGTQTNLLSSASGLGCLEVANGSTSSGTIATVNACASGAARQTWTLPTTGSTGIVSVYGGAQCLDAWGAAGTPGTTLGTWTCVPSAPNHQWTLTADGYLKGQNGLCATVSSAGGTVTLQSCTGASTQKWTLGATSSAPAPSSPTTSTPTVGVPLVVASGAGCLGSQAGSATSAAAVTLVGCVSGAATQTWTLPAVGTTGLVTLGGGAQCLDAYGGSGAVGTTLGTWTCVPTAPNHQWTLTADGYLKGQNGLCATTTSVGGSVSLQPCTGASTQKWTTGSGSTPAPAPTPAPGTGTLPTTRFGATLTGVGSGLCLSVSGNQATASAVVLAGCQGLTGQTWSLAGLGATGVASAFGGAQCLDAYGGSGAVGTTVGTWTCVASAPNHQWTLTSEGYLKGQNGLCLGVRQGATASGSPVELQSCTGASHQKWTATPQ
ncbi:ricin-type beta-trefoil lectin domain protein [Roseisolibacter agri]|uniref:Ricin B lectin domain-containing protein n=1 Tax=Roseisolibacter agri TaxID=2014610 RepID=A0AA37QK90_9BACT|nr:ricin-type beta-trefoil lectin domain protein [Roseisolibacter agri]GLC28065.1 hypothetical protein rosag_45780 [Roseisolibacter agri]